MKQYEYQKNDKWAAIKRRRELVMRMQQAKELIDQEEQEEQNRTQVSPKLEIGEPDDKHEQEADAVAKKVANGNDASTMMQKNNSSPGINRKEEEHGTLMAKSEDGTLSGTEKLQTTLDSSKGSGQALDDKTQSEMGDKMGADLSDVKIHTDSKAHEMSEGINAKAFTHEQDIYFKQGNFDTSSTEGKELLAHELAHTQQQKDGVGRKIQRQVDPTSKKDYIKFEPAKKATVKVEWSGLFHDNTNDQQAPEVKLRFLDSILLLYTWDNENWYFAYDSASKERGYIHKNEVEIVPDQERVAIASDDIARWEKMSAMSIAKERGVDWSQTLKLFQYKSSDTEGVHTGTFMFIKQKLIEGWVPEDGAPKVNFWYDGGELIIEAWKPALARQKALELGLVPDTGQTYTWYRSYFSKEKNEGTPHNLFSLRNKPTQVELDYLKANQGATPFDGSIYEFAKLYGTFATFVNVRKKEKLATFVPYKGIGISWDPGEEGGVNMRSSPFGEEETEAGQDNLVSHFPFNTTFNILQVSTKYGWYYAETMDKKYSGYIAKYLVRTDLPEPTSHLHEVKPGENALEIVGYYYTGADARDYVNILIDYNKGPGIINLKTGGKESWNGARTYYGFLVWIPGNLFALKKIQAKEDKYSGTTAVKKSITQQEKITVIKKPITVAETNDWVRVRDIVFGMDKSLIEEFNDITGFSWMDFFKMTFGGAVGFVHTFLEKNERARKFDEKLKLLGYKISDLYLALYYFTRFSLKEGFDLLDQSALLIQLERAKYQSTSTVDFKKLLAVIRKMGALYNEADRLRAQSVMRFFEKEDTSQELENGWLNNWLYEGKLGETTAMKWFRELKKNAKSEKALIPLINEYGPDTVSYLLRSYLEDYTDIGYHAYDYFQKNYLEFEQSTAKEKQADEERIKQSKNDMPVLADTESTERWKNISRYENDEDIRAEVMYILNRKAGKVVSTRASLADDNDLIWQLQPVIDLTMQNENIQKDSNLGLLVGDLAVDHERVETFQTMAMAALGIILGVLGIFSGGSAWVLGAAMIGSVALSSYGVYVEVKKYNFEKGARDTGIGPIIAVSDKEPSLLGVVLAVVGLVLDIVALAKQAVKVAQLIGQLTKKVGPEAVEQLGKLYDELASLKQIPAGLTREAFIKQMNAMLEKDTTLLAKHKKTIEVLLKESNVFRNMAEVPAHVQYAIAHMLEVNPALAKALLKTENASTIFLRLSVDIATRPGAVEQYARVGRIFINQADELAEEGVTVMRYVSESAAGTLDEMMPVMKAFEYTLEKDAKFMSEVLTDGRIRKIITSAPDDVSKIKALWKQYQAGSKLESFGNYVVKNYVKQVKTLTETLVDFVKRLTNKNIRASILDHPESKKIAEEYFERIKNNPSGYPDAYTKNLDNFDDWYKNVFQTELFEAHHMIPKNVLRDNKNLQKILDWARKNGKEAEWDFGGIDNGIMLQRRRQNILGEIVGDHANHKMYDAKIIEILEDIFNRNLDDLPGAFDELKRFSVSLKGQLIENVVKGDNIVNNVNIIWP